MNSGNGEPSKIEKNAFNVDEETYLINFVKENPRLYLKNQIDFKNTLKDRLWQQLADHLGKTMPQCKKRWKTLRDRYGKLNRNAPKRTRWIHYDSMYFLDENEQKVSSDVPVLVLHPGTSSSGATNGDLEDDGDQLHQQQAINQSTQQQKNKKRSITQI